MPSPRVFLFLIAMLWQTACGGSDEAQTASAIDTVASVDAGPEIAAVDTAEPDGAESNDDVASIDAPPLWTLPDVEPPSPEADTTVVEMDPTCAMGQLWSKQVWPTQSYTPKPTGVLVHNTGYVWYSSNVYTKEAHIKALSAEGAVKADYSEQLDGLVTSAAMNGGELVLATDSGRVLYVEPLGGIDTLWQADDVAAVWNGGFATALFGTGTPTDEDQYTLAMDVAVTQRDATGAVVQEWPITILTHVGESKYPDAGITVEPAADGGLWATIWRGAMYAHSTALVRLGGAKPLVLGGPKTEIEVLRVLANGSVVVRWADNPDIPQEGITFRHWQLRLISAEGAFLASHALPDSNVVCPQDDLCYVRMAAGVELFSPQHGRVGWRQCDPGTLVPLHNAPAGRIVAVADQTMTVLDATEVQKEPLTDLQVKSPAQCEDGSCTPRLTSSGPLWLGQKVRLGAASLMSDGRIAMRGQVHTTSVAPGAGECGYCESRWPWNAVVADTGVVDWEGVYASGYPLFCAGIDIVMAVSTAGVWFAYDSFSSTKPDLPTGWMLPNGSQVAIPIMGGPWKAIAAYPGGAYACTDNDLWNFDANGVVSWKKPLGDGYVVSLLVNPTGEITLVARTYIDYFSHFIRLDAKGNFLWQYTLPDCRDAELQLQGEEVWTLCNSGSAKAKMLQLADSNGYPIADVAVPGANKVLHLPDGDLATLGKAPQGHGSWLQRLAPDGQVRWKRSVPDIPTDPTNSAIVLLPNGKLRVVATQARQSFRAPVDDQLFWTDLDFPKTVPCGSADAVEVCPTAEPDLPWLVEAGTTVTAALWQGGVVLAGTQQGADGLDDVRLDWLNQNGAVVATYVVQAMGCQYPKAIAVHGGKVAVVVQHDATTSPQAELMIWQEPGGEPVATKLPLVQVTSQALVWQDAAVFVIGGMDNSGKTVLVKLNNGLVTATEFPGLTGLVAVNGTIAASSSTNLTWLDTGFLPTLSAEWHWWDYKLPKYSICSPATSIKVGVDLQDITAAGDSGIALGLGPTATDYQLPELFAVAWGFDKKITWQRRLTDHPSWGPRKIAAMAGGEGYYFAFVTSDGAKLHRLGPDGEYLWQYNLQAWPSPTIVSLDSLPNGRLQLVLALPGNRTVVLRP